jgi:ankyrin repeat protein
MTNEQRDRNEIAERLRDAAANGRLADVVNMIALHGNDASIMNGIDTRIVSPLYGRTPLVCAIQGGHLDVVRTLLQVQSVDYRLQDVQYLYRPLSEAARMNDIIIVKELLAKPGVDINAVDFSLCTPLMIAAKAGNQALTELFLQAGANRKLRNKFNQTAAMIASEAGYVDIADCINGYAVGPQRKTSRPERSYSPQLFTSQPHDNNTPASAELPSPR